MINQKINLNDIIKGGIQLVQVNIDAGFISKRKHPELDYWILNYTHKAQIDWEWNHATINCRGMIVDKDWNIIARPFKKFFSLDQWQDLRNSVWDLYGVKYKNMFNGQFEITQKMDGSMIVLFYNTEKKIYEAASRGSFESDQAKWANEIIKEKYANIDLNHEKYTFLFELIHPKNQIVVDYGDERDIILLGVVENETGKEISIVENPDKFYPFKIAGRFCSDDWRNLDKLNWKNAEGFVVRFLDNDIRVKIKFEEYKSLHKILNRLDEELVLEWTRNNFDFAQTISILPPDKQNFVVNLNKQFTEDYNGIEVECLKIIDLYPDANKPQNRREFARMYSNTYFSSVLFSMLDKKDYKDRIWNLIEKRLKNAAKTNK